jgi:predicted amidohydrolase
MNAVVGGFAQNVETLSRFRTQAGALGADLVLSPELSLVGYPPEDLLLKEGFIESARLALLDLAQATDLPPLLVGTVASEGPDVVLAPSGDGRDVVHPMFDRTETQSYCQRAGSAQRAGSRRDCDQATATELRRL